MSWHRRERPGVRHRAGKFEVAIAEKLHRQGLADGSDSRRTLLDPEERKQGNSDGPIHSPCVDGRGGLESDHLRPILRPAIEASDDPGDAGNGTHCTYESPDPLEPSGRITRRLV